VTILDKIRFDPEPAALFAHLHLNPKGAYADEIYALLEQARAITHPRALYRLASVQQREQDAIVLRAMRDDSQADTATLSVRFVSRVLRAQLEEVEQVYPYVATCGRELDTIPVAADDIFARFCLDAIKEMALYAAVAHLLEHLKDTYGVETLASMNPGSGDENVWPIEQQKELFAFLEDGPASIGVNLTESCLMIPNKTVSGLFFPCETGFQSCQLCQRESCSHRRAPFDPQLWQKRLGGG
jgi:hypothetical protein